MTCYVNCKQLIGKVITIKGVINFDNTPKQILVEEAVDCDNYAFIIINGNMLLTTAEAYNILSSN